MASPYVSPATRELPVPPLQPTPDPAMITQYPLGGNVGYIYIIGEMDGTGNYGIYFKVGKTENISEQISELQTGNPRHLQCRMHAVVFDMAAAEKAAHDAVFTYKPSVLGGSEWYYIVDETNFVTPFCAKIAAAIQQWCTQ